MVIIGLKIVKNALVSMSEESDSLSNFLRSVSKRLTLKTGLSQFSKNLESSRLTCSKQKQALIFLKFHYFFNLDLLTRGLMIPHRAEKKVI